MIVLDSNVLSELMRENPSPVVTAWLDARSADAWTTSVTVFEVRHGLAVLPAGKRRNSLEAAFDRAMRTVLSGRVLPLDENAATRAAVILAGAGASGRTIEFRDALIAGIVAAQKNATLATRNTKHFADTGINLIDPWSAGSP
jgi:predicted nucleic acid-binding protein